MSWLSTFVNSLFSFYINRQLCEIPSESLLMVTEDFSTCYPFNTFWCHEFPNYNLLETFSSTSQHLKGWRCHDHSYFLLSWTLLIVLTVISPKLPYLKVNRDVTILEEGLSDSGLYLYSHCKRQSMTLKYKINK